MSSVAHNKDSVHQHGGGKWDRYYFYITKDDGHLKQYKDQTANYCCRYKSKNCKRVCIRNR
ncbi:hypothetical protein HMPREF1544_06518 [Mucor circinelloides 1006PhL]|uniref:Uncharacterized protein n=1 Tax=Mucor circinelloides f. circinelloides (strain 1006PhL) TaxID=1220926 RepID=S2JE29_MUCC1|nr:hypothetical protein HMPREF1544_06518 [Mucor circinelloides 1006PhL]